MMTPEVLEEYKRIAESPPHTHINELIAEIERLNSEVERLLEENLMLKQKRVSNKVLVEAALKERVNSGKLSARILQLRETLEHIVRNDNGGAGQDAREALEDDDKASQ